MADSQWWPVDSPRVTGEWNADAAWYQKNTGLRGHNGIDLGGSWGDPIYAIDDGVVVQEGWNIPWSGQAGGIAVIVRSGNYHWGIAHFASTFVSVGESVSRGQLIGLMGNTGLALGVHGHMETLPLIPNFANGYSGRINPHSILNLQPRGTSAAPAPTDQGEEETMNRAMFYMTGSTYNVLIGNLDSGFALEYTIDSSEYNNAKALQFNTGTFSEEDPTMYRAFKNALDAVRQSK